MTIQDQLLRWLLIPKRLGTALSYYRQPMREIGRWLVESREHTNLTYHISELNRRYLARFLAVVCDQPAGVMAGYLHEVLHDARLSEHVRRHTGESARSYLADEEPRYARRVGWYAIVRAMKPSVVVETGVDKGLGSCLLTAALMKNDEQGHAGYYYGTDINPQAGYLLKPPYDRFGEVLYGDSIASLAKLETAIDLFINDSDHSVEYEMREYEAVAAKLAHQAIVIGDNAHFSGKLIDFAERSGRDFLFFHEEPDRHWYPGAGIGVAYRRRA